MTLGLQELMARPKWHLLCSQLIPGCGFRNQPVLGMGTVKLISHVDGKAYPITLNNVLHVPNAPHNLILLGRVTGEVLK
ncbi:uncharacterized protein LACBIDRAFT_316144 [Laccaria bicolor S238N-H82]|uniref:Predicted protein n=1 Tax=Laccaria bicolor (strain S238N-H82 / ATCC MYA-4686) TaxID=486041 RepID=B0D236_LACBS|nr:uncharacterized protein LACBIDRAFT_316144 [Laccaria bicolor S238N-H82]EDR11034.1 predicted protein [Laccaria bicolor S238N-H82]|eukprot:XP_001878335.1 predicted protein [Laccaria bicolor S238N-H82]